VRLVIIHVQHVLVRPQLVFPVLEDIFIVLINVEPASIGKEVYVIHALLQVHAPIVNLDILFNLDPVLIAVVPVLPVADLQHLVLLVSEVIYSVDLFVTPAKDGKGLLVLVVPMHLLALLVFQPMFLYLALAKLVLVLVKPVVDQQLPVHRVLEDII